MSSFMKLPTARFREPSELRPCSSGHVFGNDVRQMPSHCSFQSRAEPVDVHGHKCFAALRLTKAQPDIRFADILAGEVFPQDTVATWFDFAESDASIPPSAQGRKNVRMAGL